MKNNNELALNKDEDIVFDNISIIGSGGSSKGGSGSGSTPTEDPDTLDSISIVKIIDLIGEGQIGGLVNGAQSIYLNDVPLKNGSGGYNFQGAQIGISWDQRVGTPSQDPFSGFPNVETPFSMSNVEIPNGSPQLLGITDLEVDRVRVIINIPALQRVDVATGDIHGNSVSYGYELSTDGGAFVSVKQVTVTGKASSAYQRQDEIILPRATGSGWILRVIRFSANDSGSYSASVIQLSSYVEIIDSRLSYPNSAMVAIAINPTVFSSIPTRKYLVDGLYIRVPENYNPVTRTYSGIWSGAFKPAISSNPAWILYDLISSKRYGLGTYVDENQIDKSSLYAIGRYCDELVPTGLADGTLEPRYTINTVIANQTEAFSLIAQITSAFRGMSYWTGGMVCFRQDSPQSPTMIFTQANVIGGEFAYMSVQRKDLHSVINVAWNDPKAGYVQRVEYVEDRELIDSMGIKQLDIVAFGCTSRGQAHRLGKWMLYTERYESNVITFNAGLDASLLLPGEIVLIYDSFKAGKRMSGRIKSCTLNSLETDSSIELTAGEVKIYITMPDGSFSERVVDQTNGAFLKFTWTTPLDELPVSGAVFALNDQLSPQYARIVAVAQNNDIPDTYLVTATRHNPIKYAAIENGVVIAEPKTSVAVPFVATVSELTITETTYFVAPGVIGSKINLSWAGNGQAYNVSYRTTVNGGTSNWIPSQTTVKDFDIFELKKGAIVDIQVSAKDYFGNWSQPDSVTYTVVGKTAEPSPPTNLVAIGMVRSVKLTWVNPTDIDWAQTNVYMSETNDINTAIKVGAVVGSEYTVTNLSVSSQTLYFWVRAENTSGIVSQPNSISGTQASTLEEAAYMLDVLTGMIGADQLTAELGAGVTAVGTLQDAIITQQQHIDGLSGQYTVKIDSNGYVAGFGLASDPNLAGEQTSRFVVRADSFSISSPGGTSTSGTVTTPFTVLTTRTTIDGTVFDPGVYMNSALITKLTAHQINTTGLTIRDHAGNVIFSADQKLGGTYIQNATITTANIADAAITNVKIKDASISTAKIQDLAVDTLQIADNAVTVPMAVLNQASQQWAATMIYNAAVLIIPPQQYPINIAVNFGFSFVLLQVPYNFAQAYGFLYVNGVQSYGALWGYNYGDTGASGSGTIIVNIPSGVTTTISLAAGCAGVKIGSYIANAFITAMGVKK